MGQVRASRPVPGLAPLKCFLLLEAATAADLNGGSGGGEAPRGTKYDFVMLELGRGLFQGQVFATPCCSPTCPNMSEEERAYTACKAVVHPCFMCGTSARPTDKLICIVCAGACVMECF